MRANKFDGVLNIMDAQPDAVICMLCETAAGEIVGLYCGLITTHHLADMVYATNLALYVVPAYRGSSACLRLVRAFEKEARNRGAVEIMLGATSNVRAQRTERLYNALGYRTVGALTVKYLGANDVG